MHACDNFFFTTVLVCSIGVCERLFGDVGGWEVFGLVFSGIVIMLLSGRWEKL